MSLPPTEEISSDAFQFALIWPLLTAVTRGPPFTSRLRISFVPLLWFPSVLDLLSSFFLYHLLFLVETVFFRETKWEAVFWDFMFLFYSHVILRLGREIENSKSDRLFPQVFWDTTSLSSEFQCHCWELQNVLSFYYFCMPFLPPKKRVSSIGPYCSKI